MDAFFSKKKARSNSISNKNAPQTAGDEETHKKAFEN